MAQIQFIQVSPEQLQEQLQKGFKEFFKLQFDDFLKQLKQYSPEHLLTRGEVAQLFKVDISTIANWQKNGRLKPFQIGGRVYFKYSDIMGSLIPLNIDDSINSNTNELC